MQLKMERHRMLIIPDNDRDEVYLEEVFNLKSDGDKVEAIRVDATESETVGPCSWAYLEIK
ncbi:hypothetical protein ES695_13620 [Candidatus Atribacteria bacterium 1244-E10-H5-B2]|nr:MAG: hypothetical protein ES695_13620 [Candidatus Atribacteria bacterium 1244-E10-H5-B2]